MRSALTRSPSRAQQRRQERQGRDHRDDADEDGADRQAAQDRVGHEHHAGEREHEGDAAEDHGAARRRARGRDRVELLPPAPALLAVARDDEERVVDAEREAHAREHVDDEEGELERLSDERGEGERDGDRDEGEEDGDETGDNRSEDEHEHDQSRRQPEQELALLQILLRERLEVAVGAELARDGGLEAAALGALDDLDHALDAVLGIFGQPERDDGRAAVARDEPAVPRLVVGGEGARRTG